MVRDGPRHPMSSYSFFVQKTREDHKKNHPNEKVVSTEFSKMCSEMWKEMSLSDKEEYVRKSEEDKIRYEEEKKLYGLCKEVIEQSREARKEKKVQKAKEDPDTPKEAMTAYLLFLNEECDRLEAGSPNGTSDSKVVEARSWKKLNDAQKTKYWALAAKDKVRYEKEVQLYKKKMDPLVMS